MENTLKQEKELKSKENRDFTKGNLFTKLMKYIFPIVLANFIQLLFTTADLFTVKQFGGGNVSSGSIGATTNIINLVICVFWGITAGASSVIANAKGAKDTEKAKRAIGSTILIMLVSSTIVLVAGVIFAKRLLIMLNTSETYLENSTNYLTIYFLGAPFMLLYNCGAGILRAFGDAKRPFIAVIISGIFNVILNLLLVSSLDVAGVAIATISSQALATVIVFYYLIKDKNLFVNVDFHYLRFYESETKDILRIGLASGLQALIFNITNVSVQKCVNELGNEMVLGKTAATNIEGYEYALINTISQACLVIVGQNYGAKQINRVKKSLKLCIILELVLGTAFCGLVLLFNKPLLSIFINNNDSVGALAMTYGFESLLLLGLPYGICGIPECFSGYLRGMKYSLAPTIVSLICVVGYRLFYIYVIFPIEDFHSFFSLMTMYPISWILCIICYIPTSIIISSKAFKKIEMQSENN